jgi:anti-anti-sigma regulatory factor
MVDSADDSPALSEREGEVAIVNAGDYLNKLSGERVERECRLRLEEGCRALVVDFRQTGMVNSIGVSILLGVIDAAERAGAPVAFAGANEQAAHIFEMLGLTRHARLAATVEEARAQLSAEMNEPADAKKNSTSRPAELRA